MAELGIDISDQQPKSVQAFRDVSLDLVVTVCDNAAETCPVWLGRGHRVHLSFPDPAAATGTDAERLAVFRQVRDDLRARVLLYLKTFDDTEV